MRQQISENDILEEKGQLIMFVPDEETEIQVKMLDETMWLTQSQMSDLFHTDRSVITKHINNIYQNINLTTPGRNP